MQGGMKMQCLARGSAQRPKVSPEVDFYFTGLFKRLWALLSRSDRVCWSSGVKLEPSLTLCWWRFGAIRWQGRVFLCCSSSWSMARSPRHPPESDLDQSSLSLHVFPISPSPISNIHSATLIVMYSIFLLFSRFSSLPPSLASSPCLSPLLLSTGAALWQEF